MLSKKLLPTLIAAIASTIALDGAAAPAPAIQWNTVVNNGDVMPDSAANFNAYNQPSINKNGLVVIRARSKGGDSGGGTKGIYVRDMAKAKTSTVTKIIDGTTLVPSPNSNAVDFTETPSFPRIDRNSSSLAFRGMSQPVWTYTPEGGTETKIGTTGVYMQPQKTLLTGVNQLGVVPGFSHLAVPGEVGDLVLKFDMFPGAASPVKNLVAFKGNYTVPAPTELDPLATIGKTGVYFRDVTNDGQPKKWPLPVIKIANSNTVIPNGDGVTKFGSTAPPSAAGKYMVFAGFDIEEAPTMGGLYMAEMKQGAPLQTLVAFGSQVPGEPQGTVFNRLSEGVSFDGRHVAFWGAWGAETRTITLVCSTDGNKDRVAYCLANDNNTVVEVPVNQGFFVYDKNNGGMTMIARTLRDNFEDFVYWNYSGHPPSSSTPDEEGDAEPPRWRSSSFIAVDHQAGHWHIDWTGPVVHYDPVAENYRAIFKGSKALVAPDTKAVQGIYLADHRKINLDSHYTVLDTKTLGKVLDPDVAALELTPDDPLVVSSVGIERDATHASWLALNASMQNSDGSVSWAGVYAGKLPHGVLSPPAAP